MTTITMPQAGQSMEEGTILCWRKNEGEQVNKGEILLEIETDKATIEVEAVESGILRKILCPQGVTVPVLTPIAILGDAMEDISRPLVEALPCLRSTSANETPHIAAPAPGEAPTEVIPGSEPSVQQLAGPPGQAQAPNALEAKASPAARRMARERSVDLSAFMPGSGPGGRILSSDIARPPVSAATVSVPIRRPISGMRKAIARGLLYSKQNIPHFYVRLTIDAAPLYAFYRAEKAKYTCTLNDVLAVACARVLCEFPVFRSRLENGELIEFPSANIGIAVGMDDGLRVPVLVGADRMSLSQVAEESRRIIEAAQRGKVEAMGQGIFTISNLGMFGIEEFAAIINPPEAAILAVGAMRETVIVRDGALRPGRVMTMTLSADHRVVDGLMAARFLARLKEVLEEPESLGQ